MVSRLFWVAVGAGTAIFVTIKVRDYLRQATPEAIGSRARESAASLTDSARDFADRVRAAMAERETELRDTLGLPE